MDLDPDIVAAMDDDFNYSDPENELEDNFIKLANGLGSDEWVVFRLYLLYLVVFGFKYIYIIYFLKFISFAVDKLHCYSTSHRYIVT